LQQINIGEESNIESQAIPTHVAARDDNILRVSFDLLPK